MRKVIVYDSDHPGAVENICFKKEMVSQGYGFTVALAEQITARGMEIMTADLFLKVRLEADTQVLMITEMDSSKSEALIRSGAIPFLNYCFESPLIARRFYLNINTIAGRFRYAMQFKGTAERFKGLATEFSVMYFPVSGRVPLAAVPWSKRKYLVLVNRNKRAFYTDRSTWKGAIRSALARVKFALQKMIHPWIRSREIYKDRIEAIYFFSRYPTFELYGSGWENKIAGFSSRYHHQALKAYKGGIAGEDKLVVMNRFKFAICFENCAFPGYVTEKIFDCFLAGCIPVYYGAPDIEEFVPPETFIDYRKFRNLEDLDVYLSSLQESQALSMLEAARKFLASPAFDKYDLDNVVGGIVAKIGKYN